MMALAQVDVAIIGAGPAGTLLGYLLAEQYDKWAALLDPPVSSQA